MVSTLLAAGANPLVRGTGPAGSTGTPLHQAAKFGHVDVVRILIEAGIDPNLTDADVGTPLHLAVRYRRNAVAHFLKSQGASPIRAQTIGSLIASADLEAGRKIANTCRTCHDLEAKPSSEPRQGPTLWGIVGRPKAAIGGFAYSEAMIATGGVWSYDALNSFIADPKGFLPGTKMIALRGIEAPDRRAALIRFLRDLSDAPIELPN
jgi:cytochrome c2